jgi:cytochrome P450
MRALVGKSQSPALVRLIDELKAESPRFQELWARGDVAALRADASLLPRAIQEILRFESPLNVATLRVTTEPVRIGEVEIPSGVASTTASAHLSRALRARSRSVD